MKRGKKLIGLAIAVILGLSLILIPVASRLSPVQAAVTWRKSGEVILDNEKYVVDAWVIKESSTSYKMWYTHVKKDLSISDIVDVVKDLTLGNIVSDIANLDLSQFLNDLDDLTTEDVRDILDLLNGIGTVIGYATSTNGVTWAVQQSEVTGLTVSSAAWRGVGAPCVIWDATANKYKMWYTRPKTDLTQTSLETILNNIASTNTTTRKNAILDLLDSTSTVIGYATSDNGANWAVQDSEVLPGSSSSVWDSVGAPSVIKNDATYYEMF